MDFNEASRNNDSTRVQSGIRTLESGFIDLPEPTGVENMFDLNAVQHRLREFGLDGWLFYDFRGSNILARRVLGLEQKPAGRTNRTQKP